MIERDALPGNILDRLDDLEARLADVERTLIGGTGESAGDIAYYRSSDGGLYPAGHISLQAGYDYHIDTVALAWARAASVYLTLPGLRGAWIMASTDESGNVYDISGQGRTLTYYGSPEFAFDSDTLVPYMATESSN